MNFKFSKQKKKKNKSHEARLGGYGEFCSCLTLCFTKNCLPKNQEFLPTHLDSSPDV